MNSGSEPYKPYHFLEECNENFQMHIYKLFQQTQGFLLRTAQNWKKMNFFG